MRDFRIGKQQDVSVWKRKYVKLSLITSRHKQCEIIKNTLLYTFSFYLVHFNLGEHLLRGDLTPAFIIPHETHMIKSLTWINEVCSMSYAVVQNIYTICHDSSSRETLINLKYVGVLWGWTHTPPLNVHIMRWSNITKQPQGLRSLNGSSVWTMSCTMPLRNMEPPWIMGVEGRRRTLRFRGTSRAPGPFADADLPFCLLVSCQHWCIHDNQYVFTLLSLFFSSVIARTGSNYWWESFKRWLWLSL